MASRVHAPNTSLSNLSTCQQHMFCKKPLVGARGKKALLPDQRGNAFFSSMQWIFYCWCSVPQAPQHHPPFPHTYTRCLHFRNLNWGPSRGFTGRVGVGWEGGAPSFSERMKLWRYIVAGPQAVFSNTWVSGEAGNYQRLPRGTALSTPGRGAELSGEVT